MDDGAVQKKYAQFAAEASVQSSEREVLAMTVERDVEDCYKAEYMRRFEGEEFDGMISSVTQFGLYVELENTVTGLLRLEQPPLLGYIPSGSTNDFAASLGLPKTPEDAADAVVNGRPHAIDAGDFGGELFCYVAAFGAFSAVSYETPQNMKNAMGHLAYIIEGVKRLPIGEKYPARVEVGDRVFEEEFLFCSISNTTSIGGFSLDKSVEATLDDGEFEVLLIKAPTSVAEANTIVSKLLARDFNNELIHLLHADSVTVHFPTPTKWTLDGEYGGEHTDVSVQVLANALHMVF